MRAWLFVNRKSRRGHALGDEIRARFRQAGVEVVEDGRAGTPPGPVDCVVGAGGDGTILSVIPRALALGVPLGIVPAGTFNDLARTLEIPLDVAGACATVAAGQTRTIDLGCVNGVHYVNEASIGISSRIARLQTPEVKRRFGFLAIVATALQAFYHARPMHAEVSYDGRTERFKSIQLTVANSHRFGGLFNVTDAAIDDGWLDLYSVDIANLREAFSVGRAIFQGKRESVPGLRTYRSTRFYVRGRHRHRITADGEPAGRTPATFEVLPRALRVLVPPTTA